MTELTYVRLKELKEKGGKIRLKRVSRQRLFELARKEPKTNPELWSDETWWAFEAPFVPRSFSSSMANDPTGQYYMPLPCLEEVESATTTIAPLTTGPFAFIRQIKAELGVQEGEDTLLVIRDILQEAEETRSQCETLRRGRDEAVADLIKFRNQTNSEMDRLKEAVRKAEEDPRDKLLGQRVRLRTNPRKVGIVTNKDKTHKTSVEVTWGWSRRRERLDRDPVSVYLIERDLPKPSKWSKADALAPVLGLIAGIVVFASIVFTAPLAPRSSPVAWEAKVPSTTVQFDGKDWTTMASCMCDDGPYLHTGPCR